MSFIRPPTIVEESQLTRCFKMLLERLETIDMRYERLEQHMQHEQDIMLRHVNTSPWGLDISLCLYDHLFAKHASPSERARSFNVKTKWANMEWEDPMSDAALEGRFDDGLRDACDLEVMERLLPREENDQSPLLTSTQELNLPNDFRLATYRPPISRIH
jgi:hypothetical protein